MPKDIIKYNQDVASSDVQQGLDKLVATYKALNLEVEKFRKSKITVPKGSSGADAKQINQVTKQRIDDTKKITALKKEQIKVEKDIVRIRKQELSASEALGKQRSKAFTQANKLLQKEKEIVSNAKIQVRSIEDLRIKTNALVKTRDRLDNKTKKGAKEFKRLTRAISINEKQLKKYDKQIGRSQRNVGNYGKSISGLAGKFAGALGLVGGIMLARRALVGMFNTFKDFDKAQSRLASILGTTKEGVSGLTETAIQLGSTMVFTASQVTQLQTELAKLGFDQGEIVNAQRGILNLAAATGFDLAEAAAISGAALRSFGLDAREMGRVTEILGVSTTKSALDMQKLSVALPKVGATAAAAGISIERVAGLMGTLADRGLEASTIGTGLRQVFLRLSKTGLTYQQALDKITDSQDKNKTSAKIFGDRASTIGIILAENQKSADGLTEGLTGLNGELQKMADVQLDNLAGDMTKFGSAWEGVVLAIEKGDGAISRFFRHMTSSITRTLLDLAKIGKTMLEIASIEVADKADKSVNKFLDSLKVTNQELFDQLTLQLKLNDETDRSILTREEEFALNERRSRLIEDRFILEKKGLDVKRDETEEIKTQIEVLKIFNTLVQKELVQQGALNKVFSTSDALMELITFQTREAKDALSEADEGKVRAIAQGLREIEILEDKLKLDKEAKKIADEKAQAAAAEEEAAAGRAADEAAKNFIAADSIAGLNKQIAELNKLRRKTTGQSPELIALRQIEIDKIIKKRDELEKLGKVSKKENERISKKIELMHELNQADLKAEIAREKESRVGADTPDALGSLDRSLKNRVDFILNSKKEELRLLQLAQEKEIAAFEEGKTKEELLLQENVDKKLEILVEFNLQSILIAKKTEAELLEVMKSGLREFEQITKDSTDDDTGDSFMAKLLGVTDSDAESLKSSLQEIAAITADFLDSQFEAQENAARKESDFRQTEIEKLRDERRDALLAQQQGNASELDEIDKKIKEEEGLRDEAIAAEAEAVKKRQTLATIMQIANLVLAASEIFASHSDQGLPGVIVAIAAIATMLAAFASFKSKAQSVDVGGRDGMYVSNGEIVTTKGKRHNPDGSGGENVLDHVKVEKGEDLAVFTRSASKNHHKLIESFTHAVNKPGFSGMQFAKTPNIEQNDFNIMLSTAELQQQNAIMIEQNDQMIKLMSVKQQIEKGLWIDPFGNITSNRIE